jgi:hypothetical protein
MPEGREIAYLVRKILLGYHCRYNAVVSFDLETEVWSGGAIDVVGPCRHSGEGLERSHDSDVLGGVQGDLYRYRCY